MAVNCAPAVSTLILSFSMLFSVYWLIDESWKSAIIFDILLLHITSIRNKRTQKNIVTKQQKW